MKNLLLAFLLLPAIAFSQTNNATPSSLDKLNTKAADVPAISFTEQTWDYGNIPVGIPATHVFEFTNTGTAPLLVSQATASCGCTTPVWTKELVKPTKTGNVAVTYNAAREGSFMKTVTVLSNTGEPVYLTIKGNVNKKAEESK